MLNTLREGIEQLLPCREARQNLTGTILPSPQMIGIGQLPELYADEFRASGADYVVRSYDTPIAWRTSAGAWRVPLVTYSLTTTQHQYTVRQALRELEITPDMSGPEISTMTGRGHSPFGPRSGGF